VNGPSSLISARNANVSTENKHLAMPDRDTVKTQSWDMRHDETWKLETRAKTGHTSVETEPRPRHEKPCLKTVLRRDKSQDSITAIWPNNSAQTA